MLETGEIDALFVARPPSCFARGAANVVRLFPDFRAAEEAYFRKTGIFPVMHLLGLRRELAVAHPWLPASLCKAFEAAKSSALAELGKTGALGISLAWIAAELDATKKVLGPDPWPYGVAANHGALDALCRYAHRQGLVSKRFTPADLFAPSTLEASRI
jgi:4,5-dihydroxyphthalate decarboxylase